MGYKEDNSSRRAYFIHLTNLENKVKLLKKSSKKLIPAQKVTNGYGSSKPAYYKSFSDKYYMKNGSELAVLAPKNKKELAKLFSFSI